MKACSYDFETAKKEYREFCKRETSLQVFIKDWYLDAVCDLPDDWRVILVKEDNKIVAAFPFEYKKIKGYWYISNPRLACRGGIWMDFGNRVSLGKRRSFNVKVIEEILSKLPYYDSFTVTFDARFDDWSPFYWAGFSSTVYYSQVLFKNHRWDVQNDVLLSFQKYRRREIVKSLDKFIVDKEMTSSEYYDFMEDIYIKKNKKLYFSREFFLKLSNALESNTSNKIYRAKDCEGRTVAALYVMVDALRYYTTFVAFDHEHESGARALLDWRAMQDAFEEKRIFDFEGSMIPGVEEYNSRFNSEKERCYYITNYSRRYIIRKSCKNIVDAIRGEYQ